MIQYAIVRDGSIVGFVSIPPRVIYDEKKDSHVKLSDKETRKSYGYYIIEKEPLPNRTKTYGEPIYDSVNDRVYTPIVDIEYLDVYDTTQDPPVLIETALNHAKNVKHTELDIIQGDIRNIGVDWVIRKFIKGDKPTTEERAVFDAMYNKIDQWRDEIDAATDVKALHLKEFSVQEITSIKSSLYEKVGNRKKIDQLQYIGFIEKVK